ncbi:Uncharacterized membrane protein YhaH, DUF805 family [Dethiosulfatibacter aminovorans DSM 17477]|uniref:Uncharacterized membrane protein YhaH, DUF805 family n=1 Tax=Dethiosulfatibacter aminovorans DSM 17477 TaxID=1121476 RepID=A0A1M6JQ66_9FIRM|nr:DUF805 domain-containing protein [Dethiosulfatibacter aminovorans]SHJ48847.1 Uncharacterized membrane protein YhaH, DUF805 family [Dethiosulfatibacter aminovorans DSM 17477]
MLGEFFSFEGRLNRARFFGYGLVLAIIASVFDIIIDSVSNLGVLLVLLVLAIIIAIFELSICVRRLHDIEKSGWYVLLQVIPIVNVILALVLIFMKGTDGPNEYGDDPLRLNYEEW